MRGVVWLRRDLRLQDHPALTAACAECVDVIPLFVFDDPLLRSRRFGSPCVTFMHSCLDDLAGALGGTSKLSPQFRFGTLSVRTAVHAALGTFAAGSRVPRRDVLTWINELIWREFFQQILSAFPQVASGPFRSKNGLPRPRSAGAEGNRLYAARCEGRTGYPLVDAGIRQLIRQGGCIIACG